MSDIKQIGAKLYYCNVTGNVLQIVGDMYGYVRETTKEEDIQIYSSLQNRDINTISLLTFAYGEYIKLSKDSTGVRVDLATNKPIFSYEPLPDIPKEPTLEDIVITIEQENADLLLDSAIKDSKIQQNQKDLADLTLEVANLSMGGI